MLFRRKAKTLGRRGEDLAVKHLRRSGYTILDRNVELGRYEIDVIAQKDDTIVFVEVKTRRSEAVAPEESVGFTKRRRIRGAARIYRSRHDDPSLYYRFDVVSVLLPEKGKPLVTVFRDAFPDED